MNTENIMYDVIITDAENMSEIEITNSVIRLCNFTKDEIYNISDIVLFHSNHNIMIIPYKV